MYVFKLLHLPINSVIEKKSVKIKLLGILLTKITSKNLSREKERVHFKSS